MISNCHVCFYPVQPRKKKCYGVLQKFLVVKCNCRCTQTCSSKLFLADLPLLLHVVVELLLLPHSWSRKELELAAHGSCTCCTDDEEDIAASQKKTLAIALPPPHNPRASQVDPNAILSGAPKVDPNAICLPVHHHPCIISLWDNEILSPKPGTDHSTSP